MTDELPRLLIERRTGAERFTDRRDSAGFDLLSFWQWANSDLASNVLRGVLAEYVVARALNLADGVRDPWQPYDLRTPAGLTIEVKSGAFLQSWWQRAHTDISFTIAQTRSWNPDNNTLATDQRRQAALYVFAVLRHKDKGTLNPLELSQWEFYLIETSCLNEHCGGRKSLSLPALLRLDPICASFSELRTAVLAMEGHVLKTPG
jgi:hypothetical protein